MEQATFKAESLADLPDVAAKILSWNPSVKIIALQGKMGAGKTTLIKSLCEELEVQEVVNSPTFALVNEYTTIVGDPVYHFDFYRINKLEEVYDIGYEEYFYSENYCFIEWPEMVKALLPENFILVEITVDEEERRTFNCSLVTAG